MLSDRLGWEEWKIIAWALVAWVIGPLYAVSWLGFYDLGVSVRWELLMGLAAITAHLAIYVEVQNYRAEARDA